jgi:hypothetical protein
MLSILQYQVFHFYLPKSRNQRLLALQVPTWDDAADCTTGTGTGTTSVYLYISSLPPVYGLRYGHLSSPPEDRFPHYLCALAQTRGDTCSIYRQIRLRAVSCRRQTFWLYTDQNYQH